MDPELAYYDNRLKTDTELIQSVARRDQGSNEALAEIERRHASSISDYVYRKIHNPQVVEALVEDVLVRMWKYARSYEPRGKFTQWWKRIARNTVCDWLSSSKRELLVPQLSFLEGPQEAPAAVDVVAAIEEDAGNRRYPELLVEALDKALDEEEMQSPVQVGRWRRAAAHDQPKTLMARSERVSWKNFEQSVAKVEGLASAGILVNALLLAEPEEAARALLSGCTLHSPARLKAAQGNDFRNLPDRALGLPYWNPAHMRAFDEICGLTPTKAGAKKGWLSVPESRKLCTAFEELVVQSAQDIRQVLTNPQGTPLGARRVIRDIGYIICGARVLQLDGQPAVEEANRLLRQAGVMENINLRRQIPTINAYTGTAGQLSRWYDQVMSDDDVRRFDEALLITYLAGPRYDNMFAEAVVWGRSRDIDSVLAWAKRMQRTVSPRWVKYIEYCLPNTMYSIVPDLGKMVTYWPIELMNVVGVNRDRQMRIQSKLERLLDQPTDLDLRRAAEKTLATMRLP